MRPAPPPAVSARPAAGGRTARDGAESPSRRVCGSWPRQRGSHRHRTEAPSGHGNGFVLPSGRPSIWLLDAALRFIIVGKKHPAASRWRSTPIVAMSRGFRMQACPRTASNGTVFGCSASVPGVGADRTGKAAALVGMGARRSVRMDFGGRRTGSPAVWRPFAVIGSTSLPTGCRARRKGRRRHQLASPLPPWRPPIWPPSAQGQPPAGLRRGQGNWRRPPGSDRQGQSSGPARLSALVPKGRNPLKPPSSNRF